MRAPTTLMDAAAVFALEHAERTGEQPLVLHVNDKGKNIGQRTLRGMVDRGLAEYVDQGHGFTGQPRGVHVLTAKGVRRALDVRMRRAAHAFADAPTDTDTCGRRFLFGQACAKPAGHDRACVPLHSGSAVPRPEAAPGECGRRFASGKVCRKAIDHDRACDPTPPAEGRVIAHQGAGRGFEPQHADDATARAALEALAAAGLPLAELDEEYDPETSTANGYMTIPRGADIAGDRWVYVYFLTNGQVHDPANDRFPRTALHKAAQALRETGWAFDPMISSCVRAWRPAPPVTTPSEDGASTLGCEPDVVGDPDVRAVVDALIAAGHTPAALEGPYEEETSTATGFFVHPLGEGQVHVYHLRDGRLMGDGFTWWMQELTAYRVTLDDLGWATRTPTACLRASRPQGAAPATDTDAEVREIADPLGNAALNALATADINERGEITGHPATKEALLTKKLATRFAESGRTVYRRTPLGARVLWHRRPRA